VLTSPGSVDFVNVAESSMQTYSQNVSAYARAMREREADESRQRESLEVAKKTDSKIQKLALSESLRDTSVYIENRANRLDKAAAQLPFGASFTYQDMFHTEALPGGVPPCLDACQGAPVRCSTFSRTGALLATGDNSCAIRLWAKPKTAAQLAAERGKREAQRAAEEADREAARRLEEGVETAGGNDGAAVQAGGVKYLETGTRGTGGHTSADVAAESPRGEMAAVTADAPGGSSAAAGGGMSPPSVAGVMRGALTREQAQCADAADAVAAAGKEKQQRAAADAGGQAPRPPAAAPAPQPAPAGAGAITLVDKAVAGEAARKGGDVLCGADKRTRPWRSSQQLKGHKSPVTSLVFVAEGELGPKPVLFTAAGDWKVVHWEPDDGGKWRVIKELPVSHAAWIMDLCYVSRSVCALSEARGPLLVTAAGDKSLKVLVHCSADRKARHEQALDTPASPLGAAAEVGQGEGAAAASAAPPLDASPTQAAVAATPPGMHSPGVGAGRAPKSGHASPLAGAAAGSPSGMAGRASAGKTPSLLKSATAGAVEACRGLDPARTLQRS